MGAAVGAQLGRADTMLIGRKTYDSFAGAWPDREAAGGEDAGFAKALGDARKIVVSHQHLEFTWRNSEQLQGDLVEAVTALKNEPGGDIGDERLASVVRQLLAAGLLDELHLLVHPIAVRKGMRLFDEGESPIRCGSSRPRPSPPACCTSSTARPSRPPRARTRTPKRTCPNPRRLRPRKPHPGGFRDYFPSGVAALVLRCPATREFCRLRINPRTRGASPADNFQALCRVVRFQSRWFTMLMTLPSGARTKNRRTPHGSVVIGCTIS